MTFEPRRWERNGTTIELTHLPRRKSVALRHRWLDREPELLGWLTDEDAHHFAAVLDRMLDDPPATYGDGNFGGDE